MFEKVAKVLSYVLHPVFMPTYIILVLNKVAPLPFFYLFFTPKLFLMLVALVFFYTALIPSMFVYLVFRMGFVSDIKLTVRSQRPRILFLISGIYFALAYFLYSYGGGYFPTSVIIGVCALNVFGLFLLSIGDKVSLHTAALGGAVGIFMGLATRTGDPMVTNTVYCSMVLLGIVGSSRLFLGAHNFKQVAIGALWGIFSGFMGITLITLF